MVWCDANMEETCQENSGSDNHLKVWANWNGLQMVWQYKHHHKLQNEAEFQQRRGLERKILLIIQLPTLVSASGLWKWRKNTKFICNRELEGSLDIRVISCQMWFRFHHGSGISKLIFLLEHIFKKWALLKSLCRPSVRLSVCPSVRLSVCALFLGRYST
jgi:hypothetical protein